MENVTIFGSALFCAVPILWLRGPKRSELWRYLIEGVDWLRAMCEDAMLARDKERLDYLEREMEVEQALLKHTDQKLPYSLFRRNQPITRAAIDKEMTNG